MDVISEFRLASINYNSTSAKWKLPNVLPGT